jgi:hypothetical protein
MKSGMFIEPPILLWMTYRELTGFGTELVDSSVAGIQIASRNCSQHASIIPLSGICSRSAINR